MPAEEREMSSNIESSQMKRVCVSRKTTAGDERRKVNSGCELLPLLSQVFLLFLSSFF
jgi:hypothetical protein